MTQALNTFYCRGVLGTRVTADTIGYVKNGEFEFEYATCGDGCPKRHNCDGW